jgi:hypothetical protein
MKSVPKLVPEMLWLIAAVSARVVERDSDLSFADALHNLPAIARSSFRSPVIQRLSAGSFTLSGLHDVHRRSVSAGSLAGNEFRNSLTGAVRSEQCYDPTYANTHIKGSFMQRAPERCASPLDLRVTDSTFSNCTGAWTQQGGWSHETNGGAFWIDLTIDIIVTFMHSHFIGCRAFDSGGAIFMRRGTSLSITDCTFLECSCGWGLSARKGHGSAIAVLPDDNAVDTVTKVDINWCHFRDNLAYEADGAGMTVRIHKATTVKITNCLFKGTQYRNTTLGCTEIWLQDLAQGSTAVLESLCFPDMHKELPEKYCGIVLSGCPNSCTVRIRDCYWANAANPEAVVTAGAVHPALDRTWDRWNTVWEMCHLHPTSPFSPSTPYTASSPFAVTGRWKPSAKIQPTRLKASILIEPSEELPVTSEAQATGDCSPSSEMPVSAEVDPSTEIDASVEVNPSEKDGASGKLGGSELVETVVYDISGEFSNSETLPSPSASPSQSLEVLPEATAAVVVEAAAGLSAGGIAGIVIAIVALGAIGAAGWLYTRQTPKAFSPPEEDPLPPIGLSIEQYQP